MTFLRVLICGLLAGTPVFSNPIVDAQNAAAQIEEARRTLSAAQGERRQVRAYADAVDAYEIALRAARDGLAGLAAAEHEAAATVQASQAKVDAAMVAMLRIETMPPALRNQHPGGVEQAILARAILSGLQPQMLATMQDQVSRLNSLSTVRVLQEAARDDMRRALTEVKAARTALLAAVADRQEPGSAALAEQGRAMARTADTLAALATALGDVEIAQDDTPVGFLDYGSLLWPVLGVLDGGFGETDGTGLARPGVLVLSDPDAIVRAPAEARIAYAGPFLNDEQVVILRIGSETLLALNGLSVLAVSTGSTVEKGDPLGFMGNVNTTDEEFLIEKETSVSAFRDEPLYIELRIDGIAMDPEPFFENGSAFER